MTSNSSSFHLEASNNWPTYCGKVLVGLTALYVMNQDSQIGPNNFVASHAP